MELYFKIESWSFVWLFKRLLLSTLVFEINCGNGLRFLRLVRAKFSENFPATILDVRSNNAWILKSLRQCISRTQARRVVRCVIKRVLIAVSDWGACGTFENGRCPGNPFGKVNLVLGVAPKTLLRTAEEPSGWFLELETALVMCTKNIADAYQTHKVFKKNFWETFDKKLLHNNLDTQTLFPDSRRSSQIPNPRTQSSVQCSFPRMSAIEGTLTEVCTLMIMDFCSDPRHCVTFAIKIEAKSEISASPLSFFLSAPAPEKFSDGSQLFANFCWWESFKTLLWGTCLSAFGSNSQGESGFFSISRYKRLQVLTGDGLRFENIENNQKSFDFRKLQAKDISQKFLYAFPIIFSKTNFSRKLHGWPCPRYFQRKTAFLRNLSANHSNKSDECEQTFFTA